MTRTDRETYIITARDIGFRAVSPRLCKELEEEIEETRAAVETVYAALVERALKAEQERDHWKNNHDQMAQRNAVLRERPDLPVDRLPAIAVYERQISDLKEALKKGSQ